jgi:hypothetical protein
VVLVDFREHTRIAVVVFLVLDTAPAHSAWLRHTARQSELSAS